MQTSQIRPLPRQKKIGGARRRGLSMVELLCSLTITLLLLGGALPMFNELRTGMALHATAALLETDLQFARSAAITGGTSVRLSVLGTTAGGSCYVLYTGAADACRCEGRGQSRCDAGARLLRLEEQAGSAGVSLVPLQRSIVFDAHKGTVTPTATVQVVAADGRTIHQVVNIMGRVRACALAGSVGGLPTCR
ncbi:MAG: GspH/FimT family protein [Aquabacterium sp.]|nr:GspH/FimT family protein [Aquabacterium sp.]